MRREIYLTPNFTAEMRARYFREGRMPSMAGNIAVLGIDMQRHFLDPRMRAYLPSAPEFLRGIVKFYEFSKSLGIPIILTRHCHSGNILARWWGDEMRCDEDSTEIIPEVEKFSSRIVEKNTYDAFLGTGLEDILRGMRIETVIITGVMTHLCCETTARSAFNRGFNVIFPIDGTLTQNSELHECSLRALSHGFASTPTLEDVALWMRRSE